jgi:hypothetical protein
MKKNNYLVPFSLLLLTSMVNKAQAQNVREALKAESAISSSNSSKENLGSGFMALEGRIMDTEHNFVGDAKVTLKGTDRTADADAYGNYRFNELQAGTYTMIVSKQGYESYEVTFTIAMPNAKVESAKVYSTPNSKSINASPVIKDVMMKRSAV